MTSAALRFHLLLPSYLIDMGKMELAELPCNAISQRAKIFLNPSMSYLARALEAIFDEYSEENPLGRIPLAVAENKLTGQLLLSKLSAFHEYSPAVLSYTDTTGLPSAKLAMANFLGDCVFGKVPVKPSHLVISSGCTGLLNELSILLFEENDSVLIPAPYYAAFDCDFKNVGGVTVVPVWPVGEVPKTPSFEEANIWLQSNLTVESLDEAYARSLAANHKPKALLIVNPENPTGIVYTEKCLLCALQWARKHGMHLIVDEIYALSVYDSPTPFRSIVSLLDNQLGDDVHVLWGLSKDFGASGLRVGVLYSQNTQLLAAFSTMNMAIQVSNMVQEMAAHILNDRAFVDLFLKETRLKLKESYDFLHHELKELGIMIVSPAGASIFCFADFRLLMSEQSFEGERALFTRLADRGVVITPGEPCHCQIPGFFRICFAYVPLNSLKEAVRRIKEIVEEGRECRGT